MPADPACRFGGAAVLSGDRGTILLVEDEAFVAMEMEDMLADMGFGPVEVCSSYEQAERAVRAQDWPIAVFDLNLRGKRSTPLIREATKRGCRVVVTTGYEPESAEVEGLDIQYVTKPYAAVDLARAIDRAMGRGSESAA